MGVRVRHARPEGNGPNGDDRHRIHHSCRRDSGGDCGRLPWANSSRWRLDRAKPDGEGLPPSAKAMSRLPRNIYRDFLRGTCGRWTAERFEALPQAFHDAYDHAAGGRSRGGVLDGRRPHRQCDLLAGIDRLRRWRNAELLGHGSCRTAADGAVNPWGSESEGVLMIDYAHFDPYSLRPRRSGMRMQRATVLRRGARCSPWRRGEWSSTSRLMSLRGSCRRSCSRCCSIGGDGHGDGGRSSWSPTSR
jgi:hypothetical protein